MSILLKLPKDILEAKALLAKHGFELIKNQPTDYLTAHDRRADAIRIPAGHIFPIRKNHTHNVHEIYNGNKTNIELPFELVSISCNFFKGDVEEEIRRFSSLPEGVVHPNFYSNVKEIIFNYLNQIWEGTSHD